MNVKKTLITLVSLGLPILAGLLLKNRSVSDQTTYSNLPSNTQTDIPEEEICFAGIPLSQLTSVAKQIYHGEYCTIDQWGFLVFHYKSNRGHQTFHTQMTLDDDGKLINLGGHYPGQLWSSADEFAKVANETFQFKKSDGIY